MIDIVERLKARVEHETNGGCDPSYYQDCRDAIAEIESLRRQFIEGVTSILGQAKENRDIMKNVEARLDRAGL